MNDTELLDFLEAQFTGKLRNSIFIAHERDVIPGCRRMINMDMRSQPGVVHRAKTVRGAIKLAIQHAKDENQTQAGRCAE